MAKELNDQNFEEFVQSGPVLVDFWASWCGPCKMIAPVIDELTQEYEGKVEIGKVNIDENPELAAKFGVMSIPTLILMKDGEKVADKVGADNKAGIAAFIDQNL